MVEYILLVVIHANYFYARHKYELGCLIVLLFAALAVIALPIVRACHVGVSARNKAGYALYFVLLSTAHTLAVTSPYKPKRSLLYLIPPITQSSQLSNGVAHVLLRYKVLLSHPL